MMENQNRVAVVTGGSRGIGAAIARTLAQDGFDIVFSYARNQAAAEQVAEAVRALGRRALAVQADGGSVDDNQRLIAEAVGQFGRIDVLVCNAGIYPYGVIEEVGVEDIERVLNLNVRAAMIETMEASRHMSAGGRIVLMGSAFGARVPIFGISLYAASKAALRGFAQGVARDLGPKGITINVVEPGPIETDLNPAAGEAAETLKRFVATGEYGQPQNIADMVAFLVSPKAAFITGAALPVDGGMEA